MIKIKKSTSAAKQPEITIVIPTLNSSKVIDSCLSSIRTQDYLQDSIKIFIIDGGSTDRTLELALKYQVKIFKNKLKTAEAAKAIGVKKSKTPYIALIDSDNIIPNRHWLSDMIYPLVMHPDIIGSEPWEYTYRRDGGIMERYSALTGVNDPYALFTKNYDRRGFLNPNWTGLNISLTDYPKYQIAKFEYHQTLPTVGANGTIFRRDFIQQSNTDYLFDIDIISSLIKPNQPLLFAKVKVGIIHTYCENSPSKFIRKQIRRVKDLYTYQKFRKYSWTRKKTLLQLISENLVFFLYTNIIIFSFYDSVRGYLKKPDIAWFFHPIACFLTFWIYTFYSIESILGIKIYQNRQKWQQ